MEDPAYPPSTCVSLAKYTEQSPDPPICIEVLHSYSLGNQRSASAPCLDPTASRYQRFALDRFSATGVLSPVAQEFQTVSHFLRSPGIVEL